MDADLPDRVREEQSTFGLLERLRAGDHEAAETLFGMHRDRLRRALRVRIGPEHRSLVDHEDLLQNTILRALEQMDRFEWRGQGAFLAWLVRIATNLLRSELRGGAHRDAWGSPRRPLPIENGPPSQILDARVGERETPDQRAARREEEATLELALDRLPEEDRELVVNRKILGQDYASLAGDLAITEGAVRTRVSRALNKVATWVQRGGA